MIVNLDDLSDDELVDELIDNPLLIKFIKNRNNKHLATSFIYSDNKNITTFFDRLYNHEINIDFLNHLDGVGLTEMHVLFLYKAVKDTPELLQAWFKIALNMKTFSRKDRTVIYLLNKETTLAKDIIKCMGNVNCHTTEFLAFLVQVLNREDFFNVLKQEKEIIKSFLLIEDGHNLFSSKKIDDYLKFLFKNHGNMVSDIIRNNKTLFFEKIMQKNTSLFPHIYKYILSIFTVHEIEQINNCYDFHFYELFDAETSKQYPKLIFDLIIRNNIKNKNCLMGLIDLAVKNDIVNDCEKGYETLKITCDHISTYFSPYTLKIIENIIKKVQLDKKSLTVLFNNKHNNNCELVYMQKIMQYLPLLKEKIPEINQLISSIEMLDTEVSYISIAHILNNVNVNNEFTFKMDQI